MSRILKYLFVFFLGVSHFSAQNIDTLNVVEVVGEKVLTPSKTYKVESISAKTIDLHATNNLSELLTNSTNLYLKNYGIGGLSTLSIRGAGSEKTKILWNGIEINSPTLGQMDISLFPVGFIDEVEVHYGSASIINGSGGLGGSIQLNSRATYSNKSKFSIVKELGSFGIDKTSISAKTGNTKFQSNTTLFKNQAHNNFSYTDITQKEKPTLKRENTALSQLGVKQELYFKPNLNQEVSLKMNYFDSYREIGSVLGVATNGEKQTDKTTRLLGGWKLLQGKNFHQIRLAYLKDDLLYEDTLANIRSSILTEAYRGNYNFKHNFSDSMFIKVVLTASEDVAMSSGFSGTKSQQKEAVYIHFEHQTKRRILYNIALRQEIIDHEITPFVPTAGIRYFIDKKEQWVINANASRNYKAPTLNQLYWNPGGNEDLLAEEGYSAEAGITYKNNKTTFSVTPYYSLIDNWIQWLPTEKGYWSPRNIKKVKTNGLEISSSHELIKSKSTNVIVRGSYQYVNSINLESEIEEDKSVGKQLIYVPKNTFHLHLSARLKRMSIIYSQSISGKVYIDSDNTTYMPYYAPANLSLTYVLEGDGKNTGVAGIKLNNLYNEEYQILANRPMPGRWFAISLKLNLNSTSE